MPAPPLCSPPWLAAVLAAAVAVLLLGGSARADLKGACYDSASE